jgi:phage baseplate assembly protein W
MPDLVAQQQQQQELVRRAVLGWGLACPEILPGVDLGRDLELVPADDGSVDFALVEGIDNLGQSLTVALTTLLGSDVFNGAYGWDGLNALAEETSPSLVRERVRVSIAQTFTRDPRVRRITDVSLAGDGGIGQPPSGSRELDVQVAFEMATMEQTTLTLGKVVAGG